MSHSSYRNHVLLSLEPSDLDLIRPHLRLADLPYRRKLEVSGRTIDEVCFVETGLASVVADGKLERPAEVGIVGQDGMTGITVALNHNPVADFETYMQVAGSGYLMTADALREAIAESTSFHSALLGYARAFLHQVSETAAVNARHKLEERLARWLLMAHDRLDGDEIPLTHDSIALLLGTRRPGVTLALHQLESRGLIAGGERGVIRVVDRVGLVEITAGAYRATARD